jgi:hypothetical protein
VDPRWDPRLTQQTSRHKPPNHAQTMAEWDPSQGDVAVSMTVPSTEVIPGQVLPYDERPPTPPPGMPAEDFRPFQRGSMVCVRANIRIMTDGSPGDSTPVDAAEEETKTPIRDGIDPSNEDPYNLMFDRTGWDADHRRATDAFTAAFVGHPLPYWPVGFYFMPWSDIWHPETGRPEWTTRRGLLEALDVYPEDRYPPRLPWNRVPGVPIPKQLGLDLCSIDSDFWPRDIMDAIPRHVRYLERKFGLLSENLIVAFTGQYSVSSHRQDKQVFHHFRCLRLFTAPDPGRVPETQLNSCYKKGTQLCQVMIMKHFALRMCRYCYKDFTKEQQQRWNPAQRVRP